MMASFLPIMTLSTASATLLFSRSCEGGFLGEPAKERSSVWQSAPDSARLVITRGSCWCGNVGQMGHRAPSAWFALRESTEGEEADFLLYHVSFYLSVECFAIYAHQSCRF